MARDMFGGGLPGVESVSIEWLRARLRVSLRRTRLYMRGKSW